MKQTFLSFVLALLPLMANADPVEIGGIWYNLVSKVKQAEVTKMPSGKYSGAIEIPDKVPYNGSEYSVTSIGGYAFSSCSGLTSITIGNSVTSIGGYAFSSCSGLTSITIGNNVTSIGNNAFSYCSGLASVTIPNSVTSIGSYAFYRCYGLYSITIGNSVTSIGGYAFRECSRLTSVTIPNSVTSIGEYAFKDCSGLTSVTIGNRVTSIGNNAFSYCLGLTSVHISDLDSWCKIAFAGSNSNPLSDAHHLFLNGEEIKDLVIPNSVTSIGGYAFSGCSSLTSVTIPNSVTSIGGHAFSGCSSLTSVTIPNSVTSIGGYSFYGCSGLTSITIGNNVTSIGNNAFSYCSGLTSITIGNSVTSIGGYSFYGCSGLTTITIGSGVKTIGENAFAQCPELTGVYCLEEELSSTYNDGSAPLYTDASAFEGSYIEAATLHVPESAINAYMTTAPWSGFGTFLTLSGEEKETPKCATPTISYNNNELSFTCATEGVDFVSEVTVGDAKKYYDSKIKLSQTYIVSVYATKTGYEASDVVTKEIAISAGSGEQPSSVKGDLNNDGKVNVADHVELSKIIMASGTNPNIGTDPTPIIPSGDDLETDKITASFTGGAYSSINGKIQSGSQLNVKFSNKSSHSVTLTKMQLNNGETGSEGNNMLSEEVVVASGQDVSYTITVGILGISKPVISFTYRYNNKTYQVTDEWKEIDIPTIGLL